MRDTPAAVPLSACIIAFNEADRIGDCIASLAFCDEVVVVDSHSTDATVAIAQSLGARVLQRPFDGFRSQKQFAVEQAIHDWVLCLDADERVTPALRASIEAERARDFDGAAGYRFARAAYVGGAVTGRGHNIIEPLSWGVPVAYGPNRGDFEAVQRAAEERHVGERLRSPEELAVFWERALQDDSWCEGVAKRSRELIADNRHALDATVAVLETVVAARK